MKDECTMAPRSVKRSILNCQNTKQAAGICRLRFCVSIKTCFVDFVTLIEPYKIITGACYAFLVRAIDENV